jgi:hypothetical protein
MIFGVRLRQGYGGMNEHRCPQAGVAMIFGVRRRSLRSFGVMNDFGTMLVDVHHAIARSQRRRSGDRATADKLKP